MPIFSSLAAPAPSVMVFFDDRVGLEEQVVVLRIGGKLALRQVGADIREIGPAQNLEHIVEAIVELVIAQRSRLVAEHVHRLDDRMEIAFLHAMLIGHVVAHRVSLQEIAVIDEEGIAGLGADCVDNRGGAGKAQRVVRLVAVIVVGKDMDVDIGGFHDAQMRLIGGRARSKGVQQDEGRGGCGTAEKRAACDRVERRDG